MQDTFPNGYALLIGIGRTVWQDWSLSVTVKDVKAISKMLTDISLCGYQDDESHIRVLTNSATTRQGVLDGLAWLAKQTNNASDAITVIYYSGHGWVDKTTGRYYLLPHDVKPFDIPGSAISSEEFTAALRQIKSKRLLVFLDTCHAAGMATAKDEPAIEIPDQFSQAALPKGLVDELKQGAGRAVFSSSTGEQKSWVRPDRSMSIYTYHLIEALQGAGSQSSDTVVRLSNLVNHLSKAVPKSARELCHAEQMPFYDWSTEDFPVALLRGGKGLPVGGWEAVEREAAERIASIHIAGDANVIGNNNVVQVVKAEGGSQIGGVTQIAGPVANYPRYGQPVRPETRSQPSLATSASGKLGRLEAELMELQAKYHTLSQRIAARDKEIGRTLDLVRKQILEEERADWAKEREHVAARMTKIETTLSGVGSQDRDR